ncbi:MAG: hypothetical protein ACTHZ9_04575 [Leucobacter sp.]
MTERPVRKSRRASRPAAANVDPRPAEQPLKERAADDRPEVWGDKPQSQAGGENDEQLRRDRPPHW